MEGALTYVEEQLTTLRAVPAAALAAAPVHSPPPSPTPSLVLGTSSRSQEPPAEPSGQSNKVI